MEEEQKNLSARQWLERNISEILVLSKSPLAGDIIDQISAFVQGECGQLTTHQIRIVFGNVKRANTLPELKLAIRHLVYVASKQDKDTKNRELVEFFVKILQAAKRQDKEENHIQGCHYFFESIVAFHKFHHGEKK